MITEFQTYPSDGSFSVYGCRTLWDENADIHFLFARSFEGIGWELGLFSKGVSGCRAWLRGPNDHIHNISVQVTEFSKSKFRITWLVLVK